MSEFDKATMDKAKAMIEAGKAAAAKAAIQNHVKDGMKVGIGSGSTVVYLAQYLGEAVQKGLDILCVPSSFQAAQLISEYKLPATDLQNTPVLDLAIDGADEVDKHLTLIKGGGGCMLQEKILASCAKQFVVIADSSKNSVVLGEKWKKGVPIEVVPLAYRPVKLKIESLFGGIAELRPAISKAGPCVTDNGNFILDWKFKENVSDWDEVNRKISLIPGVVETGLFVHMADKVYFGMPDGTVEQTERQM